MFKKPSSIYSFSDMDRRQSGMRSVDEMDELVLNRPMEDFENDFDMEAHMAKHHEKEEMLKRGGNLESQTTTLRSGKSSSKGKMQQGSQSSSHASRSHASRRGSSSSGHHHRQPLSPIPSRSGSRSGGASPHRQHSHTSPGKGSSKTGRGKHSPEEEQEVVTTTTVIKKKRRPSGLESSPSPRSTPASYPTPDFTLIPPTPAPDDRLSYANSPVHNNINIDVLRKVCSIKQCAGTYQNDPTTEFVFKEALRSSHQSPPFSKSDKFVNVPEKLINKVMCIQEIAPLKEKQKIQDIENLMHRRDAHDLNCMQNGNACNDQSANHCGCNQCANHYSNRCASPCANHCANQCASACASACGISYATQCAAIPCVAPCVDPCITPMCGGCCFLSCGCAGKKLKGYCLIVCLVMVSVALYYGLYRLEQLQNHQGSKPNTIKIKCFKGQRDQKGYASSFFKKDCPF